MVKNFDKNMSSVGANNFKKGNIKKVKIASNLISKNRWLVCLKVNTVTYNLLSITVTSKMWLGTMKITGYVPQFQGGTYSVLEERHLFGHNQISV